MLRAFAIAALLLSIAAVRAQAQAPADSDTDLATKLSNPVAKLVTLPFQFNYDCCYGPAAGDRVVLDVQPVMPFSISDHWNLIVRTILPIEQEGAMVEGAGARFGLGDITQTFFFTPDAAPGDWIWGAGPAFLWPTATDVVIGSRKWGAGPSAIVLRQQSGWTYGLLFNHIWSYSGEREKPDISATFLQPFVGYTWPDTTSLSFDSESDYDWKGERWAAPLNLTLGHIFRVGAQPVSLSAGVRYTATARDEEAQWGARLTVTLLFPKT